MKLVREPLWISRQRCRLGEGPIWDPLAQALYWIDVMQPAVYALAGGTVRVYPLPKPPGSIYLATRNFLLIMLRSGLSWLDLASGALTEPIRVGGLGEDERFNDGRCDVHGDIWVSTMDRTLNRDIGSVVHLSPGLSALATPSHAKVGNGICFSPDDRYLYFADTRARTIYRYGKRRGSAALHDREVFTQLDDAPGRPDGCAVDGEGCLWSARIAGGRLDRYAPDGRLVDTLALPVSHPTHCAFGGPGLRTLFVTSACLDDAPDFPAGQPVAGAVLAYDVGVAGLPEARFAGAPPAAEA